MHPHILFKSDNYSHSIYVDSNIFITRNDFFDYVYRLIKIKSIIALINHPYRYCCYQELETVYANKLISTKEFINTKEFLNKNFHNKNKGLYEANLIFRNHNDKTIQEFNTDWWQGFSTICPRDQVFLPYFLKNHSLNPDLFFNTPLINVRNSPSTIFLLHKKNQLRCKTNQKLLAENYKIYYYNVIPVKNLPENQLLKHLGYDAQLDSPRTFNEHICSLKILKSTSLQTKLSDNLGAKEYIKTLPYPINSTDVLGIGNSFSDLLSQNLPNSFFIKTSHTNQSWLIENRTSVPNSLINEINSSLEMINGTKTFESNYLNIPRLLFAE